MILVVEIYVSDESIQGSLGSKKLESDATSVRIEEFWKILKNPTTTSSGYGNFIAQVLKT